MSLDHSNRLSLSHHLHDKSDFAVVAPSRRSLDGGGQVLETFVVMSMEEGRFGPIEAVIRRSQPDTKGKEQATSEIKMTKEEESGISDSFCSHADKNNIIDSKKGERQIYYSFCILSAVALVLAIYYIMVSSEPSTLPPSNLCLTSFINWGSISLDSRSPRGEAGLDWKNETPDIVAGLVWERLGLVRSHGQTVSLGATGVSDITDGTVMAIGYPDGYGSVKVFSWSEGDRKWMQKGQTLAGPSPPYSNFGASVSVNGTFLVVGAPLAGEHEQGMFRAYKWTVGGWVYHGPPVYGGYDTAGGHFAESVSISDDGKRVAVHVSDDARRESATKSSGSVTLVFDFIESCPSPEADCASGAWISTEVNPDFDD